MRSGLLFTLQTDQQERFDTPMLVTDPSLGPCLVFPATTCQQGTLSLYAFSLKQFANTTFTLSHQ
jgi:hypothetical protein